MRVTPTSGLSTDEINRLITEAETSVEADRRAKEIIGLRNKLDTLVRNTRRAFVEFGGSFAAEERKDGQQALSKGEEATNSESAEEIRQAIEIVQHFANELTASDDESSRRR